MQKSKCKNKTKKIKVRKVKTDVKRATQRETEAEQRAQKRVKKQPKNAEQSQSRSVSSERSVLQKSHPKSPVKEPQTMAELLAQTGYQLRGLRRGEEIEGVVAEIGRNRLLIDIGAKTEGLVLEKEYGLARDLIATLKAGDKLKVIVGIPENEKGQILLSLKKTNEDYKWGMLERSLKAGEELEVRGLDINKGGMIARFMSVYGFIPASQFGRQYLGNLNELYNKTFKVKVIEVDRTKNRLIFSEKAVSEAQALAAREEAVKLVKVGDILEGMVSGIMPFGIFVRVDINPDRKAATLRETEAKQRETEKSLGYSAASAGSVLQKKHPDKTKLFLEGLVHISEISWEKVDNLNQLYQVGDKAKVKVLGVDSESSRLNLSIKQLQADPWTTTAKKYKAEKKCLGTVSKLAAFGAFVALEKNIEGLIHISKIPADFQIKVGSKVEVYVEKVDLEHHRIALGLVLSKKPVGYK